MGRRVVCVAVSMALIAGLMGCGTSGKPEGEIAINNTVETEATNENETLSEAIQQEPETTLPIKEEATAETASEQEDVNAVMDSWIAGDTAAIWEDGTEIAYKEISELPEDESWMVCGELTRFDADNDGEVELILSGPYGNEIYDVRDGKLYYMTGGEGTTGMCEVTTYQGKSWVIHMDVLHAGREMYWLDCYAGGETIVDQLELAAEYWEKEDDRYDETSTFRYGEESISMQEFESYRDEILENSLTK